MNDFLWVGGRVWLDLVNTDVILEGVRTDLLADAPAALRWLAEATKEYPEEFGQITGSAAVLEALRELRHLLREICEQQRRDGSLGKETIESLNAWLVDSGPGLRLVPNDDSWRLLDDLTDGDARLRLFPIARAAAKSLAASELEYLKPCGNSECILWFLDTSKNHSRRWCSMDGCGNRHKAARFYKRTRGEL